MDEYMNSKDWCLMFVPSPAADSSPDGSHPGNKNLLSEQERAKLWSNGGPLQDLGFPVNVSGRFKGADLC